MKILTKKKQREMIAMIIENQKISRHLIAVTPDEHHTKALEVFEKQIENNADLIYEIDGIRGLRVAAKYLGVKL